MYACPLCQEAFVHKSTLNRHLETQHNSGQTFFHPGETISDGVSFQNGEVSIDAKEIFLAGEMSSRTSVTSHTARKPHVCGTCHETFSQKVDLKVHLLAHTAESSHVCEVCNKTFKNKGNLNYHRQSHTNAKPHTCAVCGKTYVKYGSLKTHYRIHTGEKPYGCDFCTEVFTMKDQFNYHMELHAKYGCLIPKRKRRLDSNNMFGNVQIENFQLKTTVRTYGGLKKNNQKEPALENQQ